jgi:hypothetical protein
MITVLKFEESEPISEEEKLKDTEPVFWDPRVHPDKTKRAATANTVKFRIRTTFS